VAIRSFELSTLVPGVPERAVDFLAKLDGHRGMHPYLHSADVVARGEDGRGVWADWVIVERPTVWGIPYSIRFPARMTRVSPTLLIGDVRAAPGCTLTTTTSATPTEAGTLVSEVTEVTAPAPLVGYMTRHARLAHTRTYGLLAGELNRLDAAASAPEEGAA
jgi:hypothetical protein